MVLTRGMKKSRKRSYARHAKKSLCKGKGITSCRRVSGCKVASGRKRSFCRKAHNVHTRRFRRKLTGGSCGVTHKGGKKTRRTKGGRKTHRNKRGGVLTGILSSARTALLPFLLYKEQKRQQRRVHRRRTNRRRRR